MFSNRGRQSWFEQLFGFPEGDAAKRNFVVETTSDGSTTLTSRFKKDKAYAVGHFCTPRLCDLRARRVHLDAAARSPIRVTTAVNDVSVYHNFPENRHATFQVASQFNCLEFPSPRVTPEAGVTEYVNDHTQGPACSIACGPATVFRNYFAKVRAPDGSIQTGQTARAMIDNLRDFSEAVGNHN